MIDFLLIKILSTMFTDEFNTDQTEKSELRVNSHQAVIAISDALDYVSSSQNQHSKRVAMMATRCATQLNWSKEKKYQLFQLGLLHDIGMQHEQQQAITTEELHLGHQNRNSVKGYQLLNNIAVFSHLACPILHLTNCWQELTETGLEPAMQVASNLIHLCDFIDFHINRYEPDELLFNTGKIIAQVRELSGTRFSPELVNSFINVSRDHSFWLSLHPHVVNYFIHNYSAPRALPTLDIAQFKQVALLFSYLVDTKSYVTAQHSTCVGLIARFLGELAKLPLETCQKLEIAGYLHDIGKLRISKSLLETKSIYTKDDLKQMSHHVEYSLAILKPVSGIADICQWISYHHERLDGSGYPFKPDNSMICTQARILAISDLFQTLTQKRPHRNALSKLNILRQLNSMVSNRQLDEKLVSLICNNFDHCFELATHTPLPAGWWLNHEQNKEVVVQDV